MEKKAFWPDTDTKDDLALVEQIRNELLESSLKVLEQHFIDSSVRKHYCFRILPKYFTGERLVTEVYCYLSKFISFESLICENISFLVHTTLNNCSQLAIQKNEQTVQDFCEGNTDTYLMNYLKDCLQAALAQYSSLYQISIIELEAQLDRQFDLIHFNILYNYIPSNTRHNWVFPFYMGKNSTRNIW